MKKQVTYKGKEYKVRWEKTGFMNYIEIYDVTDRTIFGQYKRLYSEAEHVVNKYMGSVSGSDPNLYIKQIKVLFKLWEDSEKYKKQSEKIENDQQQALNEWNGVID